VSLEIASIVRIGRLRTPSASAGRVSSVERPMSPAARDWPRTPAGRWHQLV